MMEFNRRRLLSMGASLGVSAVLPLGSKWLGKSAAAAEPENEKTALELITPETQQAIDRALVYLARQQIKTGRDKGSFGVNGYAGGVAVSGLGGLAFMCGGSAPGDGPYGKEVDRSVEFILKNTQESGFISVGTQGRDNMYGHGFATLFLSQAYGMTMRSDVGEKLRKSVDLIVRTQNDQGGWRYQPVKSDADLSITICQIMALRGARDAGMNVPTEVRNKCIEYVKNSQNPDGGFRYTIGSGRSTFALSAAGCVSLFSAGIYDGEPLEKGLKYVSNHLPGKGSAIDGSYYFYAHYYACQAMWHAGGKYWDSWYPAIRDTLLSSQREDGSWNDPTVGPEFGTAMGSIILQMPNNYLPVFAK